MTFPIMPAPASRHSPPVVTYQGLVSSTSNTNRYSFPTVSLGTEAHNRYIIAAVHSNFTGSPLVTSVTIGGVTAALYSNQVGTTYAILLVPTGTTATVAVTLNAAAERCTVAIFSVTGLYSPIPTDISTTTGFGITTSTSVTKRDQGLVIAMLSSTAENNPTVFTGVTTFNYDFAIEGANRFSCNMLTNTSAGSLTITATLDATDSWSLSVIVMR